MAARRLALKLLICARRQPRTNGGALDAIGKCAFTAPDNDVSSTRVEDRSATRISLGSAGFDWRKVGSLKEIDSQCNICACQGEGFRCGGGTHFVCMLCVEQHQ